MGTICRLSTTMLLLMMRLSLLDAHREHKVHNIVLYPDKHSWCKTEPIKQVVAWPQCSSQELDNNVCVGACFSYMVPHSEPSAPGDLIRPYCDSCQPLDSVWHTVTLDCKDEQNNPVTMQKKVQIITNCSCSSCMETSKIKPDYNTLLQSLMDENLEENLDKNVNVVHETPEILRDIVPNVPNVNSTKNTTRDGSQDNERIHQLFKKLNSGKSENSGVKDLFSKFEKDIDMENLKKEFQKFNEEVESQQHEHHHQHHHQHQHEHQHEYEHLHQHQHQHQQADKQQQEEQEQQQEEQEQSTSTSPLPQQHFHRGPHHSMVLDSDVKEKIDVEPHYLQPAVAGQEISYQDDILVPKEEKKEKEILVPKEEKNF